MTCWTKLPPENFILFLHQNEIHQNVLQNFNQLKFLERSTYFSVNDKNSDMSPVIEKLL